MLRAGLLVITLVLSAGAPTASAAALQLRDTGVTGVNARSDGVRYIALAAPNVANGPVTVVDTVTGARRTIPTPGGCSFTDIHRGTLLWSCPTPEPSLRTRGLTFDLATGAASTLTAPVPVASSFPDSVRFAAIGARWAQADFSGHHYTNPTYVDRTGGGQRAQSLRRDLVVDLDAPSLLHKLCPGQRRPLVPDDDSGVGTKVGDLAQAGLWAAGTSYLDPGDGRYHVELQHCGRKPRTLRVCEQQCSQPVIDGRIVAWAENEYRPRSSSRLVVRALSSGRVRRTAATSTPLEPLMVGHRLYVMAGRRLLSAAL